MTSILKKNDRLLSIPITFKKILSYKSRQNIIFDRIFGINPLLDIHNIFDDETIKLLVVSIKYNDDGTINKLIWRQYNNITFTPIHMVHNDYNEPFNKTIEGFNISNKRHTIISNDISKFCEGLFLHNNHYLYIEGNILNSMTIFHIVFNQIAQQLQQNVIVNYSINPDKTILRYNSSTYLVK